MHPTRSALLALSLALATPVLTPTAATAQDASAVDAEFERIKVKIIQTQRTPPAERQRVFQELYGLCGAFLDAHLTVASPEQLSKAAGFWLMLAERLGTSEQAVRDRLAALRALPSLPPDLEPVVRRFEATLNLRPGAVAPAWSAVDVRDGAQVTHEGLRGKVVLMHFWAAWDVNSKALIDGELKPFHARYGQDERLVIVGVGVPWQDDTAAAQKAAAEQHGYPWRFVFDAKAAVAQAFGVQGLPSLVLLDEEGKILAIGPGGRAIPDIRRLLTEKLGAGVAPAAPDAPGGG